MNVPQIPGWKARKPFDAGQPNRPYPPHRRNWTVLDVQETGRG